MRLVNLLRRLLVVRAMTAAALSPGWSKLGRVLENGNRRLWVWEVKPCELSNRLEAGLLQTKIDRLYAFRINAYQLYNIAIVFCILFDY